MRRENSDRDAYREGDPGSIITPRITLSNISVTIKVVPLMTPFVSKHSLGPLKKALPLPSCLRRAMSYLLPRPAGFICLVEFAPGWSLF